MYLVSILWMIGIQILIVYFIVSYIKTYSKIKTATLYNENVYESDPAGCSKHIFTKRP